MPALPNGCESLLAQEIFSWPLNHHALQFQVGELAQGNLRRDLRTKGQVVYMSRGPLVQKSPQSQALFVENFMVGMRLGRLLLACWKGRMHLSFCLIGRGREQL